MDNTSHYNLGFVFHSWIQNFRMEKFQSWYCRCLRWVGVSGLGGTKLPVINPDLSGMVTLPFTAESDWSKVLLP